MDIALYANQNQLANLKELQITSRQGLGALIWAHQSRPDVEFSIATKATLFGLIFHR